MKRITLSAICLTVALALAAESPFLREMPGSSTLIDGYESADSVGRRMAAMPLCPLEGVWEMADNGAVFAVERAEPSTAIAPARMRMVMVRSPWRSIRPGSLIGHVVTTAKPGVYEARLYSSAAQKTGLAIPRRFTIELGSDGRVLMMKPFKSPLKVNLFRLLPYMYRRVITPQQSRPDGLDGAVKIFPRQASHPLSPVYL